MNQNQNKLANPLFWVSIPPGSSKTGEVVFGVKASTELFMLMLLDGKGQVLLTEPVRPVTPALICHPWKMLIPIVHISLSECASRACIHSFKVMEPSCRKSNHNRLSHLAANSHNF